MAEKPMTESGPMVRAIIEGRKTVTRRWIKKAWGGVWGWAGSILPAAKSGYVAWWPSGGGALAEFTKQVYDHGFLPPYAAGDTAWVREKLYRSDSTPCGPCEYFAKYAADRQDVLDRDGAKIGWYWKNNTLPSSHMPKWACRLRLNILSVSPPERLLDIEEDEAEREGFYINPRSLARSLNLKNCERFEFIRYWNSLYPKNPEKQAAANPWVWRIEYEVKSCSTI